MTGTVNLFASGRQTSTTLLLHNLFTGFAEMSTKRDQTKEQLALSLKELMKKYSFEKITVTMITDGANVIRPTFYNHFHDKHEVLEFIFRSQVVDRIVRYMENGQEEDAAGMVFSAIDEDWDFYRRAFRVIGQNSFNSIVSKTLEKMLIELLTIKGVRPIPGAEALADEFIEVEDAEGNRVRRDLETTLVANYYAVSLANILDSWIAEGDNHVKPEQIKAVYYYLAAHSFTDIVQDREKTREL